MGKDQKAKEKQAKKDQKAKEKQAEKDQKAKEKAAKDKQKQAEKDQKAKEKQASLSVPIFKHTVEAIGDKTSTHAKKTANGIDVKACAAGDNTPVSSSGTGKFHLKGGSHAKSHASGCTSNKSEFVWQPVIQKCA